MTITIYTTRTADDINLGYAATATLVEPTDISSIWIDRAEYVLPDGYEIAQSKSLALEIYNAAGHHCPLACGGKNGSLPVIVDIDTASGITNLHKVRDLPW
jgi:hypothetical protein|nr:MAG TPA: hypothetical protein [Caudoviricetes sp.]